jgi:sterol desaturase/sphingolipid hydroxylase (fatty acid hydroxylase superfamily)
MILQVAVHILFYDLWFYASHLLLHTRFLYPIHSIHHQKAIPTFLDTYHGHWIEAPFQSLGYLTPLFWFPTFSWAVPISLVLVNARGMLRHDSRTTWIDGGHHMIHHKYPTYNYGEPWLDALFSTRLRTLS